MQIKIPNLSSDNRTFLNEMRDDCGSLEHTLAVARAIAVENVDVNTTIDKLSSYGHIDVHGVRAYTKMWRKVYSNTQTVLSANEDNGIIALFGLNTFAPNELHAMETKTFIVACNGYLGAIRGL